jgi:hypothetical protein
MHTENTEKNFPCSPCAFFFGWHMHKVGPKISPYRSTLSNRFTRMNQSNFGIQDKTKRTPQISQTVQSRHTRTSARRCCRCPVSGIRAISVPLCFLKCKDLLDALHWIHLPFASPQRGKGIRGSEAFLNFKRCDGRNVENLIKPILLESLMFPEIV